MAHADVAIIGGGVIGLASAFALRRAGLHVVLFEKGELGAEASSAAAGMLAPQLESHGPGPLLELCLRGRAAYRSFLEQLREHTPTSVEYRDTGALLVATSEGETHQLDAMVAWQRAMGLRAELLDGQEALRREPSLTPDVRVAAHLPDDHQLDNRKLVQALVEACRATGVELRQAVVTGVWREGETVRGMKLGGERVEAGSVVVAAGAWSSLLPDVLPVHAVEPARGQMIELRLDAPPFQHMLWNTQGYLVSRDDGRVLVGSTVERVGFEGRVTPEGLRHLQAVAGALVPSLKDRPIARSWWGFRPLTPDHLPLLGEGGLKRLFLATGHFRNGILLAPLTARLVTEWATGLPPSIDLRPFRADRPLPHWVGDRNTSLAFPD